MELFGLCFSDILLFPLKVLVTQSCSTLCDPVHCSPAGSSIHGISQARVLEGIAIRPRDRTQVCLIAGRLYHLNHREALSLSFGSSSYMYSGLFEIFPQLTDVLLVFLTLLFFSQCFILDHVYFSHFANPFFCNARFLLIPSSIFLILCIVFFISKNLILVSLIILYVSTFFNIWNIVVITVLIYLSVNSHIYFSFVSVSVVKLFSPYVGHIFLLRCMTSNY